MAETTDKAKKAKAPAKPRAPRATAGTKKAAAKKSDRAGEAKTPQVPSHEEIAALALQYWEERGRAHGDHVQDWLRAEQDLMKMAS